MIRDLKRLQETTYDLLVIGGGINGAGIAHLAAKKGLKTALIDKHDFASGTSSKSSKLMHGGLRYLENFQFDLVYEALRERTFHVRHAPHLVQPLQFLVPVYRGDRRPLWKMHLGVWLYDLLAGKERIGRHRRLSRKQMLELEPGLKPANLLGGVSYFDAQMDDNRVCIENVLMADSYGAHAANYVEVTGILKENGRAVGVLARDCLSGSGKTFEIRSRQIFCAAGAWANQMLKMDNPDALARVRPTKGVHYVTSKIKVSHGLLIPSRSDNRIFFILPWQGATMIGTTDTDFFASPDDVHPDRHDLEYLLKETRRIFPDAGLEAADFEIGFAGLRPLVAKSGKESAVPREHFIFQTESGIHFVVGGKYTTYRVIARDCLEQVAAGTKENIESLYGAGRIVEKAADAAARYHVEPAVVESLMGRYGARYRDVLDPVLKDPSLKEPLAEGSLITHAEIAYVREVEMAQTDEDIVYRRLSAGYVPARLHEMRQAGFQV